MITLGGVGTFRYATVNASRALPYIESYLETVQVEGDAVTWTCPDSILYSDQDKPHVLHYVIRNDAHSTFIINGKVESNYIASFRHLKQLCLYNLKLLYDQSYYASQLQVNRQFQLFDIDQIEIIFFKVFDTLDLITQGTKQLLLNFVEATHRIDYKTKENMIWIDDKVALNRTLDQTPLLAIKLGPAVPLFELAVNQQLELIQITASSQTTVYVTHLNHRLLAIKGLELINPIKYQLMINFHEPLDTKLDQTHYMIPIPNSEEKWDLQFNKGLYFDSK